MTVFPPLFIGLFQPIGIFEGFDKSNMFNWIVLMGFGLMSGLMTFLYGVLLPMNFPRVFENLTILTAAIYYALFFFLVASANYFYKSFWEGISGFSWIEFFSVFKYTFLIGIFPMIFILFWIQQKRMKSNLKAAQQINDKLKYESGLEEITIHSGNNKSILRLNAHSFLYAENADNYVWMYYEKDSKLQKNLVRTSLKNIERAFSNVNAVVRIHRSYIVNLNKVTNAEGNSRGLTLNLVKIENILPVSRKYFKIVTEYLKTL